MWRLFFAVALLVPVIFAQRSGIKSGQQQQQPGIIGVPAPPECTRADQCKRDYAGLQRQLDAATAQLAPLADQRNALGSEYARLQQEISTLEFQIKNPGRPVPPPQPIAHIRPPAIPVKLRPLTAQGCNPALTECQRATAEGQGHLRTETQRIQSLRAQIPEARRQNAQLQTRVNELRRQLQQRPPQPRANDNFKG